MLELGQEIVRQLQGNGPHTDMVIRTVLSRNTAEFGQFGLQPVPQC